MRVWVVAGLVFVFALALCAPASAGVVSTQNGTMEVYKGGTVRVTSIAYVAAAGETNDVSMVVTPGELMFSDLAGVQPGAGCTARSATLAVCDIGQFSSADLKLGDANDRLAAVMGATSAQIQADGGAGDDVLYGVDLRGGEGNDELHGVTVDGGVGADVLAGQTVTYANRSDPIHADLEGDADDGAVGEGDRIISGPNLIGGSAADVLVGSPADNALDGRGGDDQLVGGAGNDRLFGGLGEDTLEGGTGDDRLYAGANPDLIGVALTPDSAPSTLNGGPGSDELRGDIGPDLLLPGDGSDIVEGYGGADIIRARDRALDLVTCAFPRQRVLGMARVDARDLARGCHGVQRVGSGWPRILVLGQTDIDRGGLLRVGIGCSQDQRGGCQGTLRLTRRGRALDRRAVRITAGTAALYRLRFPAEYISQSKHKCRRPVHVTVVLSARGTTGRTQTTRLHSKVSNLGLACAARLLLTTTAGW